MPDEPSVSFTSRPTLRSVRDAAERQAIAEALSVWNGDVRAAARWLGIHNSQLYRLAHRHGIVPKRAGASRRMLRALAAMEPRGSGEGE